MTTNHDGAEADAAILEAAAAVLRRYFGGLETTIAVLDEKARALGYRTPEGTVSR